MAKTANMRIKLSPEEKQSFQEACAEMGLSMSMAFTVFAKIVGREHRIPFEVTEQEHMENL